MKTLRAPGGCPWDREQTHESILSHMVEEAYETQEAALERDWGHFREELGDLLFQVVFHAQIASEKGRFDFDDVCDGIAKKLIHRHPHVFAPKSQKGKVPKARNSEEVLKNWEQLKQEERRDDQGLLEGMPRALPALWKAYRMGQKAARVGFEFASVTDAWKKVKEEIGEFEAELRASRSRKKGKTSREGMEEEFGDVLFSLVNIARFLKLNPELALQKSNLKFAKRFRRVEKMAFQRGKKTTHMAADELEALWVAAKK